MEILGVGVLRLPTDFLFLEFIFGGGVFEGIRPLEKGDGNGSWSRMIEKSDGVGSWKRVVEPDHGAG